MTDGEPWRVGNRKRDPCCLGASGANQKTTIGAEVGQGALKLFGVWTLLQMHFLDLLMPKGHLKNNEIQRAYRQPGDT